MYKYKLGTPYGEDKFYVDILIRRKFLWFTYWAYHDTAVNNPFAKEKVKLLNQLMQCNEKN